MLQLHGESFAAGRAKYYDHPRSGAEASARIYVKVQPNGLQIALYALVDTGAPWSILGREIAEEMGLLDGSGEVKRLETWRGKFDGYLVRAPITILADEGESLELEATVFVSLAWPDEAGTFLGYTGVLDSIRFAFDPQQNDFYFGR